MSRQHKTFNSWPGCVRWLLLIAVVGLVFLPRGNAGPGTVIYFFNPDANLRDVAKLKSEVQTYFRSVDSDATLKAFVRLSDLQSALKSKPPDFLVAASWVSQDYTSKFGFKPLLVGRVGTGKTYMKVLISKKVIPKGASPSLSMVGLGGLDLKTLVPALKQYATLDIVEVSKDLDAVLAVSFEQVDMALVRQQNIDSIRQANQSAVAGLAVRARSTPITYPILSASPKAGADKVGKFVKGLQSGSAESSQALSLMGFENWGVL